MPATRKFFKRLSNFIGDLRGNRNRIKDHASAPNEEEDVPSADDYPTFPPPPPEIILQKGEDYMAMLHRRKYGGPRGFFQDTSLFALYRFYEFVVLDKVGPYRNALEAFWRNKDWPIKDIADPQDEDPARYAFLACCTFLMKHSFNERVKLGLRRDMPALLIREEAEALMSVPHNLRPYESVPEWAVNVPALHTTLAIPTDEGEVLERGDPRADPDFLAKNILLWTPHIHFT